MLKAANKCCNQEKILAWHQYNQRLHHKIRGAAVKNPDQTDTNRELRFNEMYSHLNGCDMAIGWDEFGKYESQKRGASRNVQHTTAFVISNLSHLGSTMHHPFAETRRNESKAMEVFHPEVQPTREQKRASNSSSEHQHTCIILCYLHLSRSI